MSKPETGDRAVAATFVEQAKDLIADAGAATAGQRDMFDPVTPEEMAEAREALGANAGQLTVLREARERKRGRPPQARNKKTEEFRRYILSLGPHPAATMMHIQATPPEVLVANSRRKVRKVVKGPKDGPDRVIEYDEETLTYEGAQSLRVRCAEALMPFLESKMPVAIDMSFNGIADLVITGVTHTESEAAALLDGDFLELDDDEEAA